jgi:L-ascorbate metabolism protein UlaG (beta-lactamase superfamily)
MKYTIQNSRFVVEGHRRNVDFGDLMRWQLGGGRALWPRRIENTVYPAPPRRVSGPELLVTWIGHSTVLLQTAGLNILTDPFFSKRASPFQFAGPIRVRDAAITIEDLPPIDIVLLSHNHYDHLDRAALLQIGKHHAPQLVTPLNNGQYVNGLAATELDWRQSVVHGDIRMTLMPALHWSKRSLRDANKALWGAFVIETAGGMIYFAGDTGYGDGSTFKEVKQRFGAPRLSLLPIGAYEPRWLMKPQHMNPEEAVRAHMELGSRKSLAIHHGTVQLTNEPIDAPLIALGKALADAGIAEKHFIAADVGQSLSVA